MIQTSNITFNLRGVDLLPKLQTLADRQCNEGCLSNISIVVEGELLATGEGFISEISPILMSNFETEVGATFKVNVQKVSSESEPYDKVPFTAEEVNYSDY